MDESFQVVVNLHLSAGRSEYGSRMSLKIPWRVMCDELGNVSFIFPCSSDIEVEELERTCQYGGVSVTVQNVEVR